MCDHYACIFTCKIVYINWLCCLDYSVKVTSGSVPFIFHEVGSRPKRGGNISLKKT